MQQSSLDQLVESVRHSAKYTSVNSDLIRRIGAAELAKRASLKDAIKATKNRLHQVGGMYFNDHAKYARWFDELRTSDDLRATCKQIMQHHASTRERLPMLDEFYAAIFADLAPIHSVLDIACGLNPLAIPWMPLAADATYHAVDIYEDMMSFLQSAFGVLGVEGVTEVRDVLHDHPTDQVEVALVLKAIPCLEQLDKAAGRKLMDTIRARHIVVSFPTRTVGGKNVGMRANYEAHFGEIVVDQSWQVKRFEFEGELVFRMTKG